MALKTFSASVLFCGLSFGIGLTAHAVPDSNFECSQGSHGPKNQYRITNVRVGAGESTLPFVELTRFYKLSDERLAPLHENHISGFATLVKDKVNDQETETLMIAALKMEFRDGKLINCKP